MLLVAEGAAELRKLIEVELVDENGDTVAGGGGPAATVATGGQGAGGRRQGLVLVHFLAQRGRAVSVNKPPNIATKSTYVDFELLKLS